MNTGPKHIVIQLAVGLLFALSTASANESPAPAEEILRGLQGRDLVRNELVNLEPSSTAKGSVIVFLSARCPCSASHEESLKQLASEFLPKGFRFIGIHSNADEDAAISHEHFAATKLPFPVIQDEGAKLADSFRALKTPHAFILVNGRIIYRGGVDDSGLAATAKKHFLKDALAALAEGKEPPVAESRSLGCIIKRP